jgi:hypothetical protein
MQRRCVSGTIDRGAANRELRTHVRKILGAGESNFEAIGAKGLDVMSGEMFGALGK